MTAESATRKITSAPSFLLAFLCAILTGFSLGSQADISTAAVIITVVAAAFFILRFLDNCLDKAYNVPFVKPAFLICTGIILFLFCALFRSEMFIERKAFLIGVFAFLFLLIITFLLWAVGDLTERNFILILFAAGFILRFAYVLYTPCEVRQHDVELFGGGHGHAGYIEYILANWSLPDFDVRTVNQFYHPPLHHFICAVFMKALMLIGVSYRQACESLQMLTLFYSSLCMIICERIFREIRLKGAALFTAFAIIAFHPTFIIFAGSINNDILSVTFVLAAILYTIRWYKLQLMPSCEDNSRRSMAEIIKIALCIGFGMMTKLSAYMVAPAIAIVFLFVLKQNLPRWKEYARMFSAFAVVVFPLGLWWSVRNFLLHGVPPTYVPRLSDTSAQYVGFRSLVERLFYFGGGQLSPVYDQFTFYGGTYFEFNPTVGVLKTAMFGERVNDTYYPQISTLGPILFWLGTALAVIATVVMFVCIFKRRIPVDKNMRYMCLTLFLTFTWLYYYFCFSFPHTCTMNIRYVSPMIFLGAMFIGIYMQSSEENALWKKALCIIPTVCFCIASSAVYLAIAF